MMEESETSNYRAFVSPLPSLPLLYFASHFSVSALHGENLHGARPWAFSLVFLEHRVVNRRVHKLAPWWQQERPAEPRGSMGGFQQGLGLGVLQPL